MILQSILEIKICGTKQDDCHKFAKCTDTGPGTHKCTCNEGYTGDGKTCTGNKIKKRKNDTKPHKNFEMTSTFDH